MDAAPKLEAVRRTQVRLTKNSFIEGETLQRAVGIGNRVSIVAGDDPDCYLTVMQHEVIDETSLEMGRRIAARLRDQPALLQVARDNLARWLRQNESATALVR